MQRIVIFPFQKRHQGLRLTRFVATKATPIFYGSAVKFAGHLQGIIDKGFKDFSSFCTSTVDAVKRRVIAPFFRVAAASNALRREQQHQFKRAA